MLKRFLIGIFLILLSNFSFADNWQGAPIKLIITKLGQPDELIKTRNGTSYYTYYEKYQSPVYAPDSTQPRVIIGPGGRAIGVPIPQQQIDTTTLILCSTTYEVNSNGVITKVRRNGNGCK